MNALNTLRQELVTMPEYHLKDVAQKSYGLSNKEVSKMTKKDLIEHMIGIEYKNQYK